MMFLNHCLEMVSTEIVERNDEVSTRDITVEIRVLQSRYSNTLTSNIGIVSSYRETTIEFPSSEENVSERLYIYQLVVDTVLNYANIN